MTDVDAPEADTLEQEKMPKFLQSLKTQIVLAILLLTGLFAASAFYSMYVIEQQGSDDTLLQLAGKLQYKQQLLTVQAMQYKENAPRDYPSYYRDLQLYFQDLKRVRVELNDLITAFSDNDFSPLLADADMAMMPHLTAHCHAIATELGEAWLSFSDGLDGRIGDDPEEPRLEWGAEWILEHHDGLKDITANLIETLENDITSRTKQANAVNRLLLAFAILVALGTALWFYWRVLKPLATAVSGFRRVANGEFSYRVPEVYNNEIGWLVGAFNRLSNRLDTLRKLLTRLEQGGDLHSTLDILSETLPNLMPVDWIGVLVVGVDGKIHLEKAFSDGKPDPIGQQSFEPDHTLLAECINTREPLHIADVNEMSHRSESYVFLRRLGELGRRDAIFMPIGAENTLKGVVVFASRFPNSYRTEHLELLRNLGVLVGVSLGRTLQLVESTRLANIGQFASGIVHEIRNPLATISLALEHVRGLNTLPDGAIKRVHLASDELTRLERLLSDILLYAKPLALDRSPQNIAELIAIMIAGEFGDDERFQVETSRCPLVPADRDRIRQVLLNLIRNAEQASPEDSPIRIRCDVDGADWVKIEIQNGGDPIPEKILARVFEPFFTSKSQGTGLGLPIVQRIIEAHSGEISITSDAQHGTRVTLSLPVTGRPAAGVSQTTK